MTEVIQKGKNIPRYNYYPKSSTKMVAKYDMNPRKFRSSYQKADYFAVGDSFVNMFLHAENAFFIKFKGKSLKGLAKCDKEERGYIEKWVDAMPASCEVIFNFGQVDLNFIRYYKLIHEEQYPDETFQEYVEWISSLNRNSIVLGILASPIKREHIYDVLQKYNTFQGITVDWDIITEEHQKTESVRKRWNGLLEKACKKYGVKFVNIFDYGKPLQPKFIDQNPQTVHLRYLPTLIEVQKKLPHISINIQKALQIEEEYVTEKTSRYYKNLEIIQERKRLQSIESQETKTENNSSRDGTEEEYQQIEKANQVVSSQNDQDDIEQQDFNKKQNQSLLEQINFEQEFDEDQFDVSIDLLLEEMALRKYITSYCTKTFMFHLSRFVAYPQQEQLPKVDQLLAQFFTEMIYYGIESISIEQQQCEPTWVLEIIETLTSFIVTDEGKQSITKSFVRCLQQVFEKFLTLQKSLSSNEKITLQPLVMFIISIFKNQNKFQFPLLKDKLILRIGQQLVNSLSNQLLLPNIQFTKLQIYCSSINIFKNNLEQFMRKTLQKKLQKSKLTEIQLCSKFNFITQFKQPSNKEEVQKLKSKIIYLFYDKYPFAVCSEKVLAFLIGQVERKKLLFDLKPLLSSVEMKLKSVEVDHTFERKLSEVDQQFKKKIQQIEKQEKEHSHKYLDPSKKCCSCGCLLGLNELLIKPDKTKGKGRKLHEQQKM